MIELNLTDDLSGALCAQVDPELFWPSKGGPTKAAKQVCAQCPVREACLEAALALTMDEDRSGIWGGTTERERRRIRQERRAAA